MTVTGGHTLHFYYDAQDRPAQVNYNGTMYRYVHNLQGDIIAIVDSAGNTVVKYAWQRLPGVHPQRQWPGIHSQETTKMARKQIN